MRLALAVAALILAAGCSSSGTAPAGSVDYKTAATLPPLDIPPDLTVPSRDGRYALPDGAKSATTLSGYQAGRTAQAAPGTGAVLPAVREGIRVERDGSQRWLVLNDPPEKLWPVLREFWQENGFALRLEQPELGIMETDWAENRAIITESWVTRSLGSWLRSAHGTDERDKYRTRLERTPTGGTEVYISHRGLTQINSKAEGFEGSETLGWQARPADPELEVEFLRRLIVRLGTPEERAKSMVATAQPPQRATLKKGLDGNELLEVFEPFDRAWRRVGLALDRVGFTVEDRDRQKGVYFVRYADPEAEIERRKAEKSMFSWLAFWREDEPKVKAEQYRVAVAGETDTSRVQVLDKNGAAESSPTSRRILTLLHEQLK